MRVTETIGPAWERMKATLFRPFNFGTWFSFGFIFALQSCVEGGGSNFNVPNGNSGGSSGTHHRSSDDTNNAIAGAAHDVMSSISSAFSHSGGHAAHGGDNPFDGIDPGILVGVVIAAVVIMIPLFIFMYWLGARGQMMAIRAVAFGRADIGDAWAATKGAGSSMFKFHLAVMGLGALVFLPVLGGATAVMYPMVTAKNDVDFDALLPMVIAFALVMFLIAIPFMVLGGLARNFVAPIMLKQQIGSREAWKRFWAIGKNHLGAIVMFFVLRIVFSMLAGIVGIVGGFLTCCLGFLPVLHQTLMAPYYVFERAWTLEILASMSPDFDLRTGAPPGPQGGFGPPPGFAGPGYYPGINPYSPPGGGGGGFGGGGGGYGGPPPPGGFGGPGYGPPGG